MKKSIIDSLIIGSLLGDSCCEKNGKNYCKDRFNKYREMFYPNGKKKVPDNIKQLLTTDLALLIWFLDDGSLRTDCNQFRFSTEGFTKPEVDLLIDVLWSNYGLKAHTNRAGQKGKNQHTIILGSTNGVALLFNKKFKDFVQRQKPTMSRKFF